MWGVNLTKTIESIQSFFQWFIDIFKTIGEVLTTLIDILGIAVEYLKNVLSVLPGWAYAVVVVLIIVCVLYKVLGREGNA